jgi:basic amino acid/polyamine antiporter, APA family
MARDGLIGKAFATVHPRFKTPSFGTVVTAICSALIGGLFPVNILGEIVSIGTLAAFVTVCIGVLILRVTRPDLPRPFKTPAPFVTCILGAIICAAMMLSLGIETWLRLIVWTIIGAFIYIFYGYRHSRLGAALNGGAGRASPAATR